MPRDRPRCRAPVGPARARCPEHARSAASITPGGSGARCGRIRASARPAVSEAGVCDGSTASSCSEAAIAIPVPQTCGLYRTPKASAMSAIFLHSERPPAAQMSGCTMSTAREANSSRKPKRVNSHSPPATGIGSPPSPRDNPRCPRAAPAPRTSRCRSASIMRPSRIAATAS